jgi:peptidoglycan/xylan/chitin deacetylase (PgdA/CDA1 family)
MEPGDGSSRSQVRGDIDVWRPRYRLQRPPILGTSRRPGCKRCGAAALHGAPPSAAGAGLRVQAAPVPVLCYHSVAAKTPRRHARFAVSRERFLSHLDVVAELDLRTLTLGGYARALRTGHDVSGSVVLTFDDGFADFHSTVAGLLAERGMVATAFVPTAFVAPGSVSAGWRQMSWREIEQVAAQGMEIGSHAHAHIPLDLLDPATMRAELGSSKAALEAHVQKAVESIAYPFGWTSPRLLRLAQNLGYSAGCIVDHALSDVTNCPMAFSRLRVLGNTGPEDLVRWFSGRGVRSADRGDRLSTRCYRLARRTRFVSSMNRAGTWP